MFKGLLVVAAFAGSLANAESFYCTGSGKFNQFAPQAIELKWPGQSQKVLSETKDSKIFVDIDKSNSDKSHYLEITVFKLNETGVASGTSSKGSIRDMVMLSELDGTALATSSIACVPVKTRK